MSSEKVQLFRKNIIPTLKPPNFLIILLKLALVVLNRDFKALLIKSNLIRGIIPFFKLSPHFHRCLVMRHIELRFESGQVLVQLLHVTLESLIVSLKQGIDFFNFIIGPFLFFIFSTIAF